MWAPCWVCRGQQSTASPCGLCSSCKRALKLEAPGSGLPRNMREVGRRPASGEGSGRWVAGTGGGFPWLPFRTVCMYCTSTWHVVMKSPRDQVGRCQESGCLVPPPQSMTQSAWTRAPGSVLPCPFCPRAEGCCHGCEWSPPGALPSCLFLSSVPHGIPATCEVRVGRTWIISSILQLGKHGHREGLCPA